MLMDMILWRGRRYDDSGVPWGNGLEGIDGINLATRVVGCN